MRRAACLAGVLMGLAASAFAAGAPDWAEPMKAVHARFTGQPGTVAQFGDSITITMAFFVPLEGEVRNLPADLVEAHAWIRKYVQGRCWRGWKGPEFGNEGRTTTAWGLARMDEWLKRLNPEVALILWGTNDTYQGPQPPEYTENLRQIVRKCLDNGTVPILYTIPPKGDQAGNEKETARVESFVEAARTVARESRIPLVDFYREMLARQPTDFAKTLLGDNLHPSYPAEYQRDFGDEALKHSGYTLRNYLTLRAYHEVYREVLSQVKSARRVAGEAAWQGAAVEGRPALLVPKAASAPAVDGRLDDACWKGAARLALRLLDGSPEKPKCPTEALLAADAETLYVAFRCTDPQPGALVSQKRPRDGNVWEDDSVEVFLKVGPEPTREYHHLIVNPDGSVLDDLGGRTEAWQSALKAATAREERAWTVEVAIPLAEVAGPADAAKRAGAWRLNLTRMRPPRGGDFAEESALAPTEDPSSHVPDRFAYAFFEALGGRLPAEPGPEKAP